MGALHGHVEDFSLAQGPTAVAGCFATLATIPKEGGIGCTGIGNRIGTG